MINPLLLEPVTVRTPPGTKPSPRASVRIEGGEDVQPGRPAGGPESCHHADECGAREGNSASAEIRTRPGPLRYPARRPEDTAIRIRATLRTYGGD